MPTIKVRTRGDLGWITLLDSLKSRSHGERPSARLMELEMKDMTTTWSRVRATLAISGFFCATLVAQSPESSPVDARLLEILRQRGVISTAEYTELKKLEAEMLTSANMDRQIDTRVEEMVARANQDAPKLTYKPGSGMSFATADGNFSLSLGVRIQTRFTYDAFDGSTVTPAGAKAGEDRMDFSVPRARLNLRGTAFDPHVRYQFSFDFAGDQSRPASGTAFGGVNFANSGTTNANRLGEVKDAFVEWQVADSRAFNIRAGQHKVQYSRESLNAALDLTFIDRNPGFAIFAPSRSLGLSMFGTLGGEKGDLFEYYVGAFNGPNVSGAGYLEGENAGNDDSGFLWNARLAFNPLGAMPYQQGDLRPEGERSKLLVGVGANAWYHSDDNRRADGDTFDDTSFGIDMAAMWNGFYMTAEAHWRSDAQRNGTAGAPPVAVMNPDVEAFGWFAQVNYAVIPQKLDVGLRYAEVTFDDVMATSNLTMTASREYLMVVGYYLNGHANKIQGDFGRVENHFVGAASNTDEWRLRVQFMTSF